MKRDIKRSRAIRRISTSRKGGTRKQVWSVLAIMGTVTAFTYMIAGIILLLVLRHAEPAEENKLAEKLPLVQPKNPAKPVAAILDAVDARCNASLEHRLAEIKRLFDGARSGANKYAQEVLSIKGKAELTKMVLAEVEDGVFGKQQRNPNDLLGGNPKKSYEQFLNRQFEHHVLSAEDMKNAMTKAVQAYLDEVEAAENEMYVKLRADVFVEQWKAIPLVKLEHQLDQDYGKRLSELTLAHSRAVGQEVVQFCVSWVAGDLATEVVLAVAEDLGLDTNELNDFEAAAVKLAVNFIVSAIVEEVIAAMVKQAGHDPKEKIAAQVVQSVNHMEKSFLGKTGTLREEMQKIHDQRSKQRRETITRMIGGGK